MQVFQLMVMVTLASNDTVSSTDTRKLASECAMLQPAVPAMLRRSTRSAST